MPLKKTKAIEKQLSALESIKIYFEGLRDERQESYDIKSESWQEGDKGTQEEENISAIGDLIDELETAYNSLENLFEED